MSLQMLHVTFDLKHHEGEYQRGHAVWWESCVADTTAFFNFDCCDFSFGEGDAVRALLEPVWKTTWKHDYKGDGAAYEKGRQSK